MQRENVMNVMDKRAERLQRELFKAVPNKELLMRKGINIKGALPHTRNYAVHRKSLLNTEQ